MANDSWTVETLRIHTAELREIQDKFESERDRRYAELAAERDRRYYEVSHEREKAVRIKEEAEKEALSLAREIQKYKDEKANDLRAQIGSERGLYPTKPEMRSELDKVHDAMKPLLAYLSSQQGPRALTTQSIITFVAVAAALVTIVVSLLK